MTINSLTAMLDIAIARSSDTVAIVDTDDSTITYAELSERSKYVAGALQALGVGLGSLIGVCSERSVDLIVALLGILRSGAGYVPLDPTLPVERIQCIINDANLRYVLCTDQTASIINAHPKPSDAVEILSVEKLSVGINKKFILSDCDPDIVYVIYTSGSTGSPKGVEMTARSLVNLIQWQNRFFKVGQNKRSLQFSPIGFDVSFQEIMSTLTSGGTLVLISEEQRRDPTLLLRRIENQQIVRLFLPFVALKMLTNSALRLGIFPNSLQEIITAGEQVRIDNSIREFFQNCAGCTLENQYGPTETHVVTSKVLPADPSQWPVLPSIGTPIDETDIFILDESGHLCEQGQSGELCVAGASLARGYINLPLQTIERFQLHPILNRRIYRTGDLAQAEVNGDITFLGRKDRQVKVDGFRVEPGEIEVAICRNAYVLAAAVKEHESTFGGKYLVAYFVQTEDAPGDLNELLKKHLKETLPLFMIPRKMISLNELPITATGKVDYAHLPAPALQRPQMSVPYCAPSTPSQKSLLELWEMVLQISPVGIRDGFFELGGTSILMVQLQGLIKVRLATDLSIVDMFAHPTVETLAGLLDAPESRYSVGELSDKAQAISGVRRGREGSVLANRLKSRRELK